LGIIQKQGVQNTIITYIGVVIGFFSLLFIQPNLLSTQELGLVRILLSASMIISTIMPLGIGNITTRFFPHFRNKEKKHNGYFGFMLIFIIIGSIILGLVIYLLKGLIIKQYVNQSPLFVDYFYLVIPFSIIIAFMGALNTYVSSLYKTSLVTFFDAIMNKILFILVLVMYYACCVLFFSITFFINLCFIIRLCLI